MLHIIQNPCIYKGLARSLVTGRGRSRDPGWNWEPIGKTTIKKNMGWSWKKIKICSTFGHRSWKSCVQALRVSQRAVSSAASVVAPFLCVGSIGGRRLAKSHPGFRSPRTVTKGLIKLELFRGTYRTSRCCGLPRAKRLLYEAHFPLEVHSHSGKIAPFDQEKLPLFDTWPFEWSLRWQTLIT